MGFMDRKNNRKGDQVPMMQLHAGTAGQQRASSSSGDAPPMDHVDWREQLPLDTRRRIINNIFEILKKRLPYSTQEALQELENIVVRYEEKVYSAAPSQYGYLRRICLKILTMETQYQSAMANSPKTGAANASRNPSDQGINI